MLMARHKVLIHEQCLRELRTSTARVLTDLERLRACEFRDECWENRWIFGEDTVRLLATRFMEIASAQTVEVTASQSLLGDSVEVVNSWAETEELVGSSRTIARYSLQVSTTDADHQGDDIKISSSISDWNMRGNVSAHDRVMYGL